MPKLYCKNCDLMARFDLIINGGTMSDKTKSSAETLDSENHKDLLDTIESIQPPSSKSKVFPAAFRCFLNLLQTNFKFFLTHKPHCKADARMAQGGLV